MWSMIVVYNNLSIFAANKCSLEIDYKQFIFTHPNIAIWLADAPQSVLEVMEEVANKVVFNIHSNYKRIHQKIYVRVTNLPVYDQIRNIRYHLFVYYLEAGILLTKIYALYKTFCIFVSGKSI